jgi:flagellar biosynthetic protein FlhB
MPEQFGEKTHDATPFRRQKAREDGQVARSNDLASAVMLLAALLLLMWTSRQLFEFLAATTTTHLGEAPTLDADPRMATVAWNQMMFGLAKTVLPVFGALVLVALAVNFGQIGFLFLPQKLALDFSRLDPLQGLQRMFSMNSAMRLAFGIFKIVVVAAVGLGYVYFRRGQVLTAMELEVAQIAALLGDIVFWTVLYVGMALLILAICDYAWQRWKHESDLKMTHQEIREELKTLQGDPQIVARRRQVARQLAMSRMGQAIPTADVVITNPTELAVAIKYDYATMAAPIVVAKGAGAVAQRIRRTALENDIPIVERKELARFLYKHVELQQPIPFEQYAAVAEVLKYVYELKGKTLPTQAA